MLGITKICSFQCIQRESNVIRLYFQLSRVFFFLCSPDKYIIKNIGLIITGYFPKPSNYGCYHQFEYWQLLSQIWSMIRALAQNIVISKDGSKQQQSSISQTMKLVNNSINDMTKNIEMEDLIRLITIQIIKHITKVDPQLRVFKQIYIKGLISLIILQKIFQLVIEKFNQVEKTQISFIQVIHFCARALNLKKKTPAFRMSNYHPSIKSQENFNAIYQPNFMQQLLYYLQPREFLVLCLTINYDKQSFKLIQIIYENPFLISNKLWYLANLRPLGENHIKLIMELFKQAGRHTSKLI